MKNFAQVPWNPGKTASCSASISPCFAWFPVQICCTFAAFKHQQFSRPADKWISKRRAFYVTKRIGFETGSRSETRIGFLGGIAKFIESLLQQTARFHCTGCWQDRVDVRPLWQTQLRIVAAPTSVGCVWGSGPCPWPELGIAALTVDFVIALGIRTVIAWASSCFQIRVALAWLRTLRTGCLRFVCFQMQ